MDRHCHPRCEMSHPDVDLECSTDQLNLLIMDFWTKLLEHELFLANCNKVVNLFEQILLKPKLLLTRTRTVRMKMMNPVIKSNFLMGYVLCVIPVEI